MKSGHCVHYRTVLCAIYISVSVRFSFGMSFANHPKKNSRMKKYFIFYLCLFPLFAGIVARAESRTLHLDLREAIVLAQLQSVDAAVALNELKTSYWEYRTHLADQLPEVSFSGSLPSYYQQYRKYQKEDGAYTYVRDNSLGLSGKLSVVQHISLTGGTVSLNSSLDFSRQLGAGAFNEYMSVPVGLSLSQPIFGTNYQKWHRRIEPIRYQEAKASYIESVEAVTLQTINYFFNLLLARESLVTAIQNLENAEKIYEIATAKRGIGHISENEQMRLKQSVLQAKASQTEAQSTLNARMFQLRAFLGLSEKDVIEPVLPETTPGIRMDYQEVLEKAQENNSFAKNILRRQLEADFAVASAKGNQRSIRLNASIGYTGKDESMRNAYRGLLDNQIVEVGLTIPLLDWGKRKGKVKVAQSNREVVLSRVRQEEMNFNQNIFLLVENFNNQAAQLEIAVEVDELAEKRYRTSVETYLIGKISILDLNDAQSSKDYARQKHIHELFNYWYYFYNIRSVALYDFLNNRNLDADFDEIVK